MTEASCAGVLYSFSEDIHNGFRYDSHNMRYRHFACVSVHNMAYLIQYSKT